jgi:hypothetical protein
VLISDLKENFEEKKNTKKKDNPQKLFTKNSRALKTGLWIRIRADPKLLAT